ncbi:MAG: fumarate hydratase [Anaerolineales bacterium]
MQPDLTQQLFELLRLTSTDLSRDVKESLQKARIWEEDGSAAEGALDTILDNVDMARKKSTPICQDTGKPINYVDHAQGWSTCTPDSQITKGVAKATRKTYLRPNSVNAVTGVNIGDDTGGDHYPSFHFSGGRRRDPYCGPIVEGGMV